MSKSHLPDAIKTALRSLERRLFVVLFGFGIGRLMRNAVFLVLGLYALDRLLEPPVVVRFVLLGLAIAVLLVRSNRDLLAPLRTRPPRRDLAAIWESRHAELGDRLATAVELSEREHDASQEMVDAVTAQAVDLCPQLDARQVVPTGRSRRSLLTGTAATAAILLGVWAFPDEAAIFMQRLSGNSIAWPSKTTLVLMPAYIEGISEAAEFDIDGPEEFTLAVARGSVVSLRIRAEGETPDNVSVLGWNRPRQMHSLGGGEFVLRLPPLLEDAALTFRGGDDNDDYPRLYLRAGDAPGLASWNVTAVPPSYTGLPSEQGNFHELRVLVGTEVKIEFQPDRLTQSVAAVFLDGTRTTLPTIDGNTFEFNFPVVGSGDVRLSLTGTDGFRNDQAGILKWNATPDRSPELEFLFPTERWLTVPGGSIPVALGAMDDFGLSEVTLEQQTEGKPPLSLALQEAAGRTELRQLLRVPAPERFSAESFEDNRFRFVFAATDAAQPEINNAVVKSPWIEVVPREVEEQRLAERIIELRQTLESLRDRAAAYSEADSNPSARQVRRLVRELDSVLADAESYLLERLYSNLDRQTKQQLPVVEQLLRSGMPQPGDITEAMLNSTAAAPLDRSGMLLDLCYALHLTRKGPAADLLAGANDDSPNSIAAGNLRDDIDGILEILLSWEDYNSAINLLRGLLERQRGLYLRTREASER